MHGPHTWCWFLLAEFLVAEHVIAALSAARDATVVTVVPLHWAVSVRLLERGRVQLGCLQGGNMGHRSVAFSAMPTARIPLKSPLLIRCVGEALIHCVYVHILLFKAQELLLAWRRAVLVPRICAAAQLCPHPSGSPASDSHAFLLYEFYNFERQDCTWHKVQAYFMG